MTPFHLRVMTAVTLLSSCFNHLGTVHASAQLALAEASRGEFLLRAMGDMQGIVPVVRRLEYDETKAHTMSASVEWFVTRAQV